MCCFQWRAVSDAAHQYVLVIMVLVNCYSFAQGIYPVLRPRRDTPDPCYNFSVGDPDKMELYSPGYPAHYPKEMKCYKVLDAGAGNVVSVDFRDVFKLESHPTCEYDYLDIRDGMYGYNDLLVHHCGDSFPLPVESTQRYLYLYFHSDETIEDQGFRIVYSFMARPTEESELVDPLHCQVNVTGVEGLLNRTDVDSYCALQVNQSRRHNKPLDATWKIEVKEGWKIHLVFLNFKLERPNDCESNFVQVFRERRDLDKESELRRFCGASGDTLVVESNLSFVRFLAQPPAVNSTFVIQFTAFREGDKKGCLPDEFNCQDDTCIARELRCNGRTNCRLPYDEDKEECQDNKNPWREILSAEHIIYILVIFCLILSGMCFGFIFNCVRKLVHDHQIIQEHIRQSREGRLDEAGKAASRSRSNISSAGDIGHISPARGTTTSPHRTIPDECYVPTSGDLLPILIPAETTTIPPAPANGDAVFMRDNTDHQSEVEEDGDDLEMSSYMPEMRDNECQTRESLFLNSASEHTPTPPPPPPPAASRLSEASRSVPRPLPPDNSSASGFSTFGRHHHHHHRPKDKDFASLPHHHHHHHHQHPPPPPPPAPALPGDARQRFRAEAVIEMANASPGRPFSVESTKSAPDVIVTH